MPLLAATRRKGDLVPDLVIRVLGNPVILVATYLSFLGNIFVCGLLIHEGVVERAAALLVSLGILAVTQAMLHRVALNPRGMAELRRDGSPG